MPSPSRAIASAIKHSNLLILIKWKRLWETNFISVIYSGNTLINPLFYVIYYENDRDYAYKEVKRAQLTSILTSARPKTGRGNLVISNGDISLGDIVFSDGDLN